MFFKKRDAAEKVALREATEKLAAWKDQFSTAQAMKDAGEKYFAMDVLAADIKDLFSHKPFADIEKAQHPRPLKKVLGETALGTFGLVVGGAMTAIGGPVGIAYGVTITVGSGFGVAEGVKEMVSSRHGKKLYLANKPFIDELNALREQIAATAQEVWNDMLVHPGQIAKSSKAEALLRYPALKEAFTEAAKTQMREQESLDAQKKPKPGGGFKL